MSSAILYLGIVAIWAFVLVPRWLRRDHEQPETDEDADAGSAADATVDHGADRDLADGGERGYPAPRRSGGQTEILPPSRSRALQARRRLLTMLLALTGGAAACYLLKLTPWWVIVPPFGMLGLFVLLLRQVKLADAERARRRSVQAARARAASRHAEPAGRTAVVAFEPGISEPPAEVIDISARVGDQLYDQYADATVRAVGD